MASEDISSLVLVKSGQNTEDLITQLEDNPNVLFAEPNYLIEYYSNNTPSDPNVPYQSWTKNRVNEASDGTAYKSSYKAADINVEPVWKVDNANGVSQQPVVAISDSGVDYNHPD